MDTKTAIFIGVGVYLILMIIIGIYSAKSSGTADDFIVSGRRMPIWLCSTTLIATWFGAETVLSVSATFAKDGLAGIPGDPFGATACLVIAALLFARLLALEQLLAQPLRRGEPAGRGVRGRGLRRAVRVPARDRNSFRKSCPGCWVSDGPGPGARLRQGPSSCRR